MAESKAVETLAERIIRNVRDSRLAKLVKFALEFSLTAEIKFNGRPISSLMSFIIFLLGIAYAVRLVFKRVVRPFIYPALRHLIYRYVRRNSYLLPSINLNSLAQRI